MGEYSLYEIKVLTGLYIACFKELKKRFEKINLHIIDSETVGDYQLEKNKSQDKVTDKIHFKVAELPDYKFGIYFDPIRFNK